ncbi:MAG: KOW domain-containing RNA-binding protein [Oscillospiraceae bacterium]|nr:KOW domain-containing RNA-binding protein [Oscillospiraceae bacterium]
MEDFVIGRIVKSKAGRDKSLFLVVTGVSGKHVMLADGKQRPLDNPKRKNPCHLALTNSYLPPEEMATDRALRRALREFK